MNVIVVLVACDEEVAPPEPDAPARSGDTAEPPASVCYPGVAEDFGACVPLVRDVWPEEDYTYPAPLDGSHAYAVPIAFVDGARVDPLLPVAPHFVWEEVADPTTGDFAVVQVRAVIAVQELRDVLGPLIVTSGYRSPGHNAAVGGATWSRHLYGDAFDLVPVDASLDELGDLCVEVGAAWVEVYDTHVHCDWRDGTPDPAFF